MAKSVASQITGDDIISELIRNADAGAFKVRYTVLVPCIFNVYLHPRAGEPRPEYKILEKQWMIQFHGDQEERLRPGEIEIYSELGSARPKDFGAGAMTTFITRHPAGNSVAENSEVAPRAVLARVRYRDAGMDKTLVMTS